jgi:hypothetical protein
MGKIYNIVLNSQFGTVATAGDSRAISFFYDWSLLPQGRYKLTFQFNTSTLTTTNTSVLNIFTDLCQTNTFFASNPDGSMKSSYAYQYLGMARATGTGTNNTLYAPNNFNGELYLEQRPQNNLFSILLFNNDDTKTYYSATIINFNYSLILNLELLD